MSKRFLCFLATGAFVVVSGVPARATIAVSSQFNIAVYATADAFDATATQSAAYSASQLGTINPYSDALSVTSMEILPGAAPGTATTTSAAAASWASADAGVVTMTNMGWSYSTPWASANYLNGYVPGGADPIWGYTFTATSDGTFDMACNVTASGGSIFGLWGMYIKWTGPGGDLSLLNPSDPTASASFSRPLTNGQTYTIQILNDGNISTIPGAGAGSMDGDFRWHITAVPEPFSLAGLGLGLAALAARRRLRK